VSLRHQFIPNEPAAQTSKPAKKPTSKPVEKIATQSTASERIEPPEPVSPSKSHAVRPVSAHNTHCPTCGRPMPKPKFDRKAYQRDYMRARRARKKAQE
jgi:hypothetical protein